MIFALRATSQTSASPYCSTGPVGEPESDELAGRLLKATSAAGKPSPRRPRLAAASRHPRAPLLLDPETAIIVPLGLTLTTGLTPGDVARPTARPRSDPDSTSQTVAVPAQGDCGERLAVPADGERANLAARRLERCAHRLEIIVRVAQADAAAMEADRRSARRRDCQPRRARSVWGWDPR